MHVRQSPSVTVASTGSPETAETLLETIIGALEDGKGEDVVSISLSGKSSLADYMVIASGDSARQVSAIAERVLDALKNGGFGRARVEGLEQADWVLVDAGDVIVHIFRPEVRAFYNLEKMWGADFEEDAEALAH